MPDPRALGRARVHALLAAQWASQIDGLPNVVLRFLAEDVPWLLQVAHAATADGGDPVPAGPVRGHADELGDELAAHQWLTNTVNLVRLATAAIDGNRPPALWSARESDVRQALADLCDGHRAVALEVAVRELAETSWSASVDVPGIDWNEVDKQ
jgi:hypothetical protein